MMNLFSGFERPKPGTIAATVFLFLLFTASGKLFGQSPKPLYLDPSGTPGARFPGATVFSGGLAIGGTFDMPLVQQIYAASAQEARSVGIHVLSTCCSATKS